MKKFVFLVVLISFPLINVALCQTDKPLTNQDVVDMSNASLPVSVIISKIKTSKVEFKTELADLKSLTDEKVSESVISAMIDAQSAQSKASTVISEQTKDVIANPKSSISSPPFVTYRELDKEAQKQRLKGPAVVQIAAPASDVMPLLIRSFQSWDYQIENETNRSLLLSKPVTGFGNKLLVGMAMGGNNMRYKLQIGVAEFQGITSVNVSAWVTSDNAFGKTTQESLNHNKKWRPELDELLRSVKTEAERPTASAASEEGLTQTQKTRRTSILPAGVNADGFPSKWKSLKSGTVRTLRKDGDHIYFETDLTDEQIEMGLVANGQVSKQGDFYLGKLSYPMWFWWRMNPTTGKKVPEKVCQVEDDIKLRIVSQTRIEVDGDAYPDGTKFNKECKPNKKKVTSATAVWIPIE